MSTIPKPIQEAASKYAFEKKGTPQVLQAFLDGYQLATDGRELPKEIVDDISDFLKDAEYRGEYTIRKYGGSMIITFKDGTTAKMSIGMWKGAEVTLDATDGRESFWTEEMILRFAELYRWSSTRITMKGFKESKDWQTADIKDAKEYAKEIDDGREELEKEIVVLRDVRNVQNELRVQNNQLYQEAADQITALQSQCTEKEKECEELKKEVERLKGIMKVVFYATLPNENEETILKEWEKCIERNNL